MIAFYLTLALFIILYFTAAYVAVKEESVSLAIILGILAYTIFQLI